MITIETIHALKIRTNGTKGELALKIDISKVYDRVDWGFMRRVLSHLRFVNRWIHWVMMCVLSFNYSVTINMDRVGLIYPRRG